MHADELIKLYAPSEKNFARATLTEAKVVKAEPEGTKLDVATISDGAMVLIPTAFMMIWAIGFFMALGGWKVARSGMKPIKHFAQCFCKNCQFFTDSPYLKCALHPSIVLTKQAIDCSDYWLQNGRC